jgi:lipoate-protein ligase A
MRRFRFIFDEKPHDAYTNMAIDEAMLLCCRKLDMPTVRFYHWNPPAISIGYFQSMEEEVDVERCNALGIDVVRRITGGGAVLHEYELTYSFVCSLDEPFLPSSIPETYKLICSPILRALNELGLNASFVPLNDVVVDGRKISGNAQTRKHGVLLQHGTILLRVDVAKMFSLLKVPREKLRDKLIEDVSKRVTSLEQLGKPMDFYQFSPLLKKGFEHTFSAELVQSQITEQERRLAEKIREERYASHGWNFKR